MRLHNFCIDKKLAVGIQAKHGLAEVQPGRWAHPPVEDRHGRPIDNLRTKRSRVPDDVAVPPGDRFGRRKELIQAIDEAGLKRPKLRNERS